MSQLQVVCGLVWREGLFLAARKRAGKTNSGYWELPGGKVGEQESVEQALMREFQEELGMEIRVRGILGSVEQAGIVNLKLIALEASCGSERPGHIIDHDSVIWVNPGYWHALRLVCIVTGKQIGRAHV